MCCISCLNIVWKFFWKISCSLYHIIFPLILSLFRLRKTYPCTMSDLSSICRHSVVSSGLGINLVMFRWIEDKHCHEWSHAWDCYDTRYARKVLGLVSQMIYFKAKLQTTSCPLQRIPLESNTLSHPSLPLLHALLEGFFRDPPQLCRHGLFDAVLQNCSPWWPPWAWRRGKNHMEPGSGE